MISTKGLSKAAVLAALYNHAQPRGMGFLAALTEPAMMTEQYAARFIGDERDPYFDYLNGRVMKVELADDGFDERLYDRDNGHGAAQRAIDQLRAKAA